MDEVRYKVLFNGMVVMEMPEETVKTNMARLFKCDLARIEPLFSGQTAVLKRNLTEQEANHYIWVLREAGAIVHKERDLVQPAKPAPSVPLTLVEKPEPVKPAVAPVASVAASTLARSSADSLGGAPVSAPAQRHVYKSPTQELAELRAQKSQDGYCELNFISLEGRLGRIRYLAWPMGMMLVLIPVILVGTFLATKFPPLVRLGAIVVAVIMLAFQFTLIFRRLHDINMSAWWMLLLFLMSVVGELLGFSFLAPLVGILFGLFLSLKPGDENDNEYGPPPPPNSMGINLMACGMLLVIVLSIGQAYFSNKEFAQPQRQMERQIQIEEQRGSRQ